MALKNLESLLLPVVPAVVRGVVAGLKGTGSAQASGQTRAVALSFTRHLPPGIPGPDSDPMMRYEPANYGEAHAAQRAGRSGSSAGVPDSRTPARTAGAAILSGWSLAAGGIGLLGASWRGLTATATVATDSSLPGHLQVLKRLPAGRHPRSEVRFGSAHGRKCAEDGLSARSPAFGMFSASIGGR
jgi:hypothetical protein